FDWLWQFWWNHLRHLVKPDQQAEVTFHFNGATLHAGHKCSRVTFDQGLHTLLTVSKLQHKISFFSITRNRIDMTIIHNDLTCHSLICSDLDTELAFMYQFNKFRASTC